MTGIADSPLDNPHTSNHEVHYRLYLGQGGPTTLCVQSFDYHDYDANRFLTSDAYDDDGAAERALNTLLSELARDAEPSESEIAARLASAGAPLTRRQELLWHLTTPREILAEDVVVTRPAAGSALDLVGGYIGYVAKLNRATNAYTLADSRRIARYASHAHLSAAETAALTTQIQSLAQTSAT